MTRNAQEKLEKIEKLERKTGKRIIASSAIIVLSVTLLLLPSLLTPQVAGVHTLNLFELGPGASTDEGGKTNILGDGNPLNGPDWGYDPSLGATDGIFDASGSPVGAFATKPVAFLADDISAGSAVDHTVYVVGAKNGDPISAWHWGTQSSPTKDDFGNGYAYAAFSSGGHLIVYSGFERLDASGDSHVDIQFFQDGTFGLIPTGPPCPSEPCSFSGTRIAGDIIVSMDFTKGGDVGNVTIHEWTGTTFAQVGLTIGPGCNPADTICAFNNAGTINGGPWPNFGKQGKVITSLGTNQFTEFGVDVFALVGFNPCISKILGATRSSQSFTATLKDFAGPAEFPVCDLKIEKTGPAFSKPTDTVTYTYTITNIGAVTLYKQSIVDNVTGTLTSNCGASLAAGIACTFTASHLVTISDPDPLVNLVTATYNNKADFTGTSLVRTATHSVDLVHPNYTLTKSASPTEAAVGQTITYTFVIQNTGDVGLVRVSVIDSLLGSITGDFPATLAAGSAAVTVMEFRTIIASDPTPLVNMVTATYGLDPATALPNQLSRSATATVTITRPVVKVTGFGYENVPNPPIPDRSGIVSGTVTYTVKVMNFGPARAVLSGSLVVTTNASSGTLSCTPSSSLTIDGTVEPNAAETKTFTLVCVYTNLNDNAAVQADLTLMYKSESAGSPTFEASGSPASIVFHVQSD